MQLLFLEEKDLLLTWPKREWPFLIPQPPRPSGSGADNKIAPITQKSAQVLAKCFTGRVRVAYLNFNPPRLRGVRASDYSHSCHILAHILESVTNTCI